MKTIYCYKCGNEKILNETCKSCGYKPDKGYGKQIIIAVISLIIVSFTINMFTDSKPKKTNTTTTYSKLDAYIFAEGFVKDKLKAPRTAKFPSISVKKSHVTNLGNNEFQINSWVDSQNSFGALIRTKFSCKIIFTKNNVRIENLTFD